VTARPGPAPASRVVGVRRLADYLKRKLESDPQLRGISVRGEITNFSVPRSGHYNFDLKEGEIVLRCFAWAADAATFPTLKNGVSVVASGSITAYGLKSTYQLIVRAIVLEGVGDVHALFEARKKKLAAEGLFDPARKRPLPPFPFRVALVSSRGANGAIDFVTILRERAPHVRVVWCESAVQGPSAAVEICDALRRASREEVDAIVLTRGGGSFEDLFVFSDESVVRAVARARHPVISAIGHTVDQQLCDFAADVHVETPSAAAKAVGFETRELRARIDDRTTRARTAVDLRLERLRNRLSAALVRSKLADGRLFLAPLAQRLGDADDALRSAVVGRVRAREICVRELTRRLAAHDPTRRLAERARALQAATFRLDAVARVPLEALRRRAGIAADRLGPAVHARSERAARRLELARAHLDGKNPEAILQRGYAIVTYRNAIVRDPQTVPAGERVEARLARGTLLARVERDGKSEDAGSG